MREQHLTERTDLVVVEPVAEQPRRARLLGEQLMDDLLAIEVMAKGGRRIGLARSATVFPCCCSSSIIIV